MEATQIMRNPAEMQKDILSIILRCPMNRANDNCILKTIREEANFDDLIKWVRQLPCTVINELLDHHDNCYKASIKSEGVKIMRGLLPGLTIQESNVAWLLNDGIMNKEIAKILSLSIDGVNYHIRELKTKLRVNNRGKLLKKIRNLTIEQK